MDEVIGEKSEAEVFAISQACSMAKKAVLDYLRMAVPGANEREIAARIDRQFRVYGVDNIALLVSAGKDSKLCLHQPRDYVIQEGDTVSAHVDILYLHYNGLYGASLFRGEPDERRTEFYAKVEQHFEEVKESVLAGESICNLNTCDSGYTLISGIGADTSEPPLSGKVAKGSTFTVTVCSEDDEYGGVIIADTFVMDERCRFSLGGGGLDKVLHKK